MTTLTLKVPGALAGRLTELARRRGISRSALVREALQALLENGRPRKRPTVLELAGDLCGCVEGPGDLSYNKKYMEDFGR
jgi:hypothetical protein